MEKENPRARKRRNEEAGGAEPGNPFFERADGLVTFDPAELDKPEYQALLRSLYEHYKRGATIAPLPFQVFPVRDVPNELLLQLVGGDVRTFVRLAGSDPVMRQRLLPLTPRFVCQVWPDVALLLSIATDTTLLQQIEAIGKGDSNAVGVLMGVAVDDESSDSDDYPSATLTRLCEIDVSLCDMPSLSSVLRRTRSGKWKDYYFFFDAGMVEKVVLADRLMLPSGHVCRYSDVAAIKLAAELLETGVRLNLRWRFTEEWRLKLYMFKAALFEDYTQFSGAVFLLIAGERLISGWNEHFPVDIGVYGKIAMFTTDLCAALNGHATVMFEFDGIDMVDEAGDFSVDAAHLLTLMKRHDANVKHLLETLGNGDPLYVDVIPVDTLANSVCLLAQAADCGQFWFELMAKTWQGYQKQRARRGVKGKSIDAPYHCTECRATATRFDRKFGLPFCPQQQCLGATFTKLHQHGLYSQ